MGAISGPSIAPTATREPAPPASYASLRDHNIELLFGLRAAVAAAEDAQAESDEVANHGTPGPPMAKPIAAPAPAPAVPTATPPIVAPPVAIAARRVGDAALFRASAAPCF